MALRRIAAPELPEVELVLRLPTGSAMRVAPMASRDLAAPPKLRGNLIGSVRSP
jgi:hypothetical protein